MSASPVFAPAAPSRPFTFVPKNAEALLKRLPQAAQLALVTPASRLEVRPEPEMVSCGIREVDSLAGGLPRGCLTEVCGPASSGRTSLLLAALSAATRREEVGVLVDASDGFDPLSAAAAGVDFTRLLWVRCGQSFSPSRQRVTEKNLTGKKPFAFETRREWESRLEQVLKITDLLLQSGGFGLVAIDLGDVPLPSTRRIPLTSWFRFRRAVENTPTILLVIGQEPCARTCASLLLQMQKSSGQWPVASFQPVGGGRPRSRQSEAPPHAQLLSGMRIKAEVLRSRLERKPMQSASTFSTKTAWAG